MAVIKGTSLNDTLNVINPGDELRGLDGNDTLTGSTGNERLYGGNGNDSLIGNAGDDQMDGGPGVDTMNGGAGTDYYVVDNSNDMIIDSDKAVINTTVNFDMSARVSGGATNLQLSLRASGITGTGSSGNDVIVSYASNTILRGGGGNDLLKGASGSKLYGGAGNDALEIANFGAGSLTGGAGDDRYNVYQVGSLTIDESSDGGAGTDTIFTTLDFSLHNKSGVSFFGAIENLTLAAPGANLGEVAGPITGEGNIYNNVIIGNRQNNILSGREGNDTIYGSYGNDSIDGGSGDDELLGQEGNDTLNGGLGTDTLNGGNGNDVYTVSNDDIVLDSQGIDTANVTGSWATTADVEFITITVTGTVNVTAINNVNTIITGNASNNILISGSGNDTLIGGAGIDYLGGGINADVFVFGGTGLTFGGSSTTNIRQDIITDFSSAQGDKIRISASTFAGITSFIGSDLSGTQGFISNNFGANNTNIDRQNAYFVYNTFNGFLYFNQNLTAGGPGTGGGYFATLTNLATLAGTDFSIVA